MPQNEIGYCSHTIRIGQVWETDTGEEVTVLGWSGDLGQNLHVHAWDPGLQVYVVRTVHQSSVGNWKCHEDFPARTLWDRLLDA
jgi:hypothetical protein